MSGIIQQQIQGLAARLTQLKATDRLTLQASGLEYQAAVDRQECDNGYKGGWRLTEYNALQALSGIEKTAFDVAIAHALGAGIPQGLGVPTVLLAGWNEGLLPSSHRPG